MEKPIIRVKQHMWLDCSISWFVTMNGKIIGGEIFSESDAYDKAEILAEEVNGIVSYDTNNSNEVFNPVE
jgi:hypothetical protein